MAREELEILSDLEVIDVKSMNNTKRSDILRLKKELMEVRYPKPVRPEPTAEEIAQAEIDRLRLEVLKGKVDDDSITFDELKEYIRAIGV
jgi:hypothetical protein